MLWIQPSWYGCGCCGCGCYIEKDRTYTVYDDEKGICGQAKGADLREEIKRGTAPDGTVRLANGYWTSGKAFYQRNVCMTVEDYTQPPEPNVPMVKFNLHTGEMKQNGKLDIETEIFLHGDQGGIRIGDTYCIDWEICNIVSWEFFGGYLVSVCSDNLELALWNIHMEQNCLRGCIRLFNSYPYETCVIPSIGIYDSLISGFGDYYPFELNLDTGVIDLGEWGRTQLLPAKEVKKRILLGVPIRDPYIIKKGSILSNDFPCDVVYEGLLYPSAEAAYHSAKTKDMAARKAFCSASPEEARRMADVLRYEQPDFDEDRFRAKRVQIMEDVLYDKFTRNKMCHDELLRTGERQLIAAAFDGMSDYNLWGIKVPGDAGGLNGDNLFGKLLTHVRRDLAYGFE